jgi:phosphoesterase RecJ-like protein
MKTKTITSKHIWLEIKKAKNILLHLHPSPDGDSAGSALSMMHILTKMNKKVTVIAGDSEYPEYLKALPGSDQIVPKNYFQIDLTKFDLFIVVDTSSLNQISKLGEVKFPENLKVIVIDHHSTNEKFGFLNFIKSESPATAQILYEIYHRNRVKISKEAAVCLFVGIYTDTGGFKYPSTSSKTLAIASELAKINPDFSKTIFDLENNDEPDRLKFLALLLNNIETFYSGHVAIASVTNDMIQRANVNRSVVNSLEVANMLKSVKGWDIGISFIEVQPNTIKLSLRTRNSDVYDLGKIAAATGAGGGHKAAAGATLNMPFNKAKKFLLETISSIHPELGKP